METLKGLGEYGVLGLLVFVLVLWLARLYGHSRTDARAYRKDARLHQKEKEALLERLQKEQGLRISDAQRLTDLVLKLQAEVISSVASIKTASTENAKLRKLVAELVDQVRQLLSKLDRLEANGR